MRELFARLRDYLRRAELDRELAEELQFHQDQLARDQHNADTLEAQHAARRRFGNVTGIRESARDRWSFQFLDNVQQDIRYALRGLRRSPGFTAAVLLTLGLGIGANAAMFNVIDQLMFRPYPMLRDPDSVHRVYLRVPGAERFVDREIFPYARYLDLATGTSSFSHSTAFHQVSVAVGEGVAARERPIAAVSASFFGFFDARPALGRFFVASEDVTPVGASVVVLSFAYWQNVFGGRDVLGKTLLVDNVLSTIIGVAPKGFVGVFADNPPAVFIPITSYGGHDSGNSQIYWNTYRWDWTEMMVRRKPGVTIAQANADLTEAFIRSRAISRALNGQKAPVNPVRPIAIAGALKTAAGPYPELEARTLVWVSGVAFVVLMIACANVANLFFARTLRRRREIALRVALGVSRRRLAAQSLTESLVFAVMGCIVGVAIAQWGGLALRRLVLATPESQSLFTDSRTLVVAMLAALVAGLVTSFAPMLFASQDNLSGALKAGAREGVYRRSRVRNLLLVSQGALSVVLLIGAGLFVLSLNHLQHMPLGYNADRVLMVQWQRRGETMSTDEGAALRQRVLSATKQIGGVESAAWVSSVPLQGTSITSLFVPGLDSVGKLGRFTFQSASADYFNTVGTRILSGRSFNESDRAGAPGAIVVSAAMARVLWPDQSPLGKCIRFSADTMPCGSVVGVAEDAVHDPVKDEPLRYYLHLEQFQQRGASLLVVRVKGRTEAMQERLRSALQKEMPGQQYVTVSPMAGLLEQQRRSWTVGASMFVAFGALALVVAAVGLYGVIAYNVAQRMHELGVRVALGAQGLNIMQLVLGEGLRLALLGVVVGCALALAAAHWIQPLLFEQSARDPLVYLMVTTVLIVVSLLASAVPALRAMRADPNTVLRAD